MVSLTGHRPDAATAGTTAADAAPRPDDLSDNAHRQLIGYIGLVLPFVLIFLALWRDGMALWRSLESVSAYYYTGAVAAFVGMLVALALFLFTYRGYSNEHHWADRWTANTAACAALVVAFFPTQAPTGVAALTWWAPWVGFVHHAAAVVLFLMFAVFALWLFRLSAKDELPTEGKQWRNRIYIFCGVLILACIVWAGVNGRNGRPIFWPESIALIAFSVSWLVKGYALDTIMGAARSMLGR
jgi:succinate dehydrogenase/fumarate reductase cytochrome b subunit